MPTKSPLPQEPSRSPLRYHPVGLSLRISDEKRLNLLVRHAQLTTSEFIAHLIRTAFSQYLDTLPEAERIKVSRGL